MGHLSIGAPNMRMAPLHAKLLVNSKSRGEHARTWASSLVHPASGDLPVSV